MSSIQLQGEKLVAKEECHEVTISYSMGVLRFRFRHECEDETFDVDVRDEDDGLRALEKLEAFAQGHIMEEHLNRSGVDF